MKKGLALYETLLIFMVLGMVALVVFMATTEEKENKMGISKLYVCLECHIEFKITVESDKDEKTIKDQYPDSAAALEDLDSCPFCMGDIEEIN